MPSVELVQFPYSHYNEKARWALDWKAVPHSRRSLLPGPHIPVVKRLSGQEKTPVLCIDGEVIAGSARILDALERRYPEPPLLPADPALRRRALEIQEWFDEEVGPCVRRSLFAVLLGEPGYVCTLFASQRPLPVRALYRATLPLVGGLMRRSMGIAGPESLAEADRVTREAFDLVAKQGGPDRPLVGDAFSVADLTAAALLAPAADPPDSPMAKPRPLPPAVADWLARWADHPGAGWVRAQYRHHRAAAPDPAGV